MRVTQVAAGRQQNRVGQGIFFGHGPPVDCIFCVRAGLHGAGKLLEELAALNGEPVKWFLRSVHTKI